jgi:hypothetical protein
MGVIMPVWVCNRCEHECTIQRDSCFKPEVCIYKDTGNGFKQAHWGPVHI